MSLARKRQDSSEYTLSARHLVASLFTALLVLGATANAAAQEPTDPNPGALTLSGGVDFLNQSY